MEMNQKNSIEERKNNAGLDLYIETAPNVKLYVKDYGEGKPVILIHGWLSLMKCGSTKLIL
jgi:hypothetical protein